MHPGIQVCSMCKVDKKDEVKKHKISIIFSKHFHLFLLLRAFLDQKLKITIGPVQYIYKFVYTRGEL